MDKLSFLSKYFEKYATAVELLQHPTDEHLSQMEEVETVFDDRYGPGWANDKEDLLEELLKNDALSVAIKDDNGTILGYVYGYKCGIDDVEDAEEELEGAEGVNLNKIKRLAKKGKIFYIANLVVKPEVRVRVLEMLLRFKEEIKSKGYKYAVMEALSDSARLIFNDDGSPKERRLNMFGAKLEMTIDEGDGRRLIFVKLL
jgi:hypothetical protein